MTYSISNRPDPNVPVEDVVGAMSELVLAGKVCWLGLSGTDVQTLHRAQAIHPIAAVQNEYFLLERAPEEVLLNATIRSGAVFVAHSPLGRGRLAGPTLSDHVRAPEDYRRTDKRFANEAIAAARPLADVVFEIAKARGLSPAAIALAWLLAQHSSVRVMPGSRGPPQIDLCWAAEEVL